MTETAPKFLACGDAAVTVHFGNEVNVELNRRVHALARAVERSGIAGVMDTVPTYCALTVHFDPLEISFNSLCDVLRTHLDTIGTGAVQRGQHWQVPVVFGGAFGEDLESCAEAAGMSAQSLIEAFTAPLYTVMMIGFMPGFSYLAGLPNHLARPRRAMPRGKVPAGSVSIGGVQAAIGSIEGPSGWHMLGRTPALPFLQSREPMFLFAAGDEISFLPIELKEWHRLIAAAERGEPVVWPAKAVDL